MISFPVEAGRVQDHVRPDDEAAVPAAAAGLPAQGLRAAAPGVRVRGRARVLRMTAARATTLVG